MRMVEIGTNPFADRVHAGEVSMSYAPDRIQATPERYHISGHNFNLGVVFTYSSVI